MLQKTFFSFLLVVVFAGISFGQNKPPVYFSGKVSNTVTGSPMGGVTIELTKNGSVVESVTTGSNGRFKLKPIEIDATYKISFKAAGFITRFVDIDLTGIPPEHYFEGGWENPFDMTMVPQLPQVDYSSISNKPTTVYKYNSREKDLKFDDKATSSYKSDLDKILKEIEEKQKEQEEKEKKFQQLVADGDNAGKSGDFKTAVDKYTEALAIKEDPAIRTKLTDVKKKYEDAEKNKGVDKKYTELVTEAEKALAQKDYATAKSKYEEAGKLKPTEKVPPAKIKEITALIAAEMKKEEDYAKFITDGNKAFEAKNYDEAIKQYESALKIKPTEQEPKDLINKARTAKDGMAAKEKEFAELVKKGDDYAVKKSFADAITSYESALNIKKDPAVQAKLDKAKADKELAEKNQAADKAYLAKMESADKAFAESKWDAAIADYEAAALLKPTEKRPKDQIAIAKQKKEEEAKNAELNKNYADAMKKGNEALAAQKWDDAIASYEKALTLKPNEAEPKEKLAEAKQKKSDAVKNAELEKQYTALMTKGEGELTAKTWDAAITTFEAALKLKPNESKAKEQIELAKNKKQEELDKADKLKRSQELVVKGDAAMPTKKYQEAIDFYQQAIDLVNDPTTVKKLDAAKEALKAEELANKQKEAKEKEYNDLIAKADSDFDNSAWEKAIANYEAALKIKVGEKHPTDRIAQAKIKLEADKKNAELNKKYSELMTQGETEMNAKTWDKAILTYQAASKLKPDENKPKEQIELAQQKKKEEAELAALQKKASDLIAKGDLAMTAKKWDDAINNYQQAFDLVNDPKTQEKINAAKKAKEDEENAKANAAEKEAKYLALIAEGDNAFNSSNWTSAIEKYESALKIKAAEKHPTSQILLAKQKIEAEKANEAARLAKYKAAMDAGIANYSAGDFDNAIKKFEEALIHKPDDKEAKDYIQKANNEKDAKAGQLKKMYDDIIRQADKDFDAKNYEDAKNYYTRANKMFPNEEHPKTRLKEIEVKLAEQKDYLAKKAKYDEAIKKADLEFNASKYEASIPLYEAASKILDEAYPKDQIAIAKQKIEKIKNQTQAQAQLEAEYKALIKKADDAFTANDLDNAFNLYTEAKTKKPTEKYPDQQIAKINDKRKELSKLEEIKRKYDAKIAEADAKFNAEQYEQCKKLYTEASVIKPDETYPQEMIDKANAKLKEVSANELKKQYDLLIAQADKDFDAKNYADAKGYYDRASKLNANDPHPKNRIIEIDKLLAADKANAEKRKQYDAIVLRADKELNNNDFDKSIASYNEALQLFSAEQYPKDQIAEANRRKAENLAKKDARKRYDEAMAKGMTNFNAGTFDAAIVNFEQALQAIPNDAEANRMLEKAKVEMAKKKDFLNQQYNAIIKAADENFEQKVLADAKELYQRALKFKPDEQYPKDQLKKIEELEGVKVEANNYNKVIAEANKKFNMKDYATARNLYVDASNLMPAIAFPKERIKEIDKILNANSGNSTALNGTLPVNNTQNAAVVKETYYGTEVNLSAEEAQKMMVKARLDDQTYKSERTQEEVLDQQNKLAQYSETADVKRLANEEHFENQKEKQDNYNEKGEQKRQDNASSYSNLKEDRYNAEGDLSHDRNEFLIKEQQRFEQIKTDNIYNEVGTDEIRKQNVVETGELKEKRYETESALEGNTNDKRLDKNKQLINDQFTLEDQMGSMDTMRENNARWMANYKEQRYISESALEGNTDEKRAEKNNQLINDQFALEDQMATMDTMRINNATSLSNYKENRYNAESTLEGNTNDKRQERNNTLINDQFTLEDQLGSMDTMRENNARWMADYKEKRYVSESALEGDTDEKRMERNNELIKNQFSLEDQLGSMDTIRANNATWMANYKEKRYVAESALEGDTDEKRMERNNQLRNDQFALQDQLSTMDTMRSNNAVQLSKLKEDRYNGESNLADANKDKTLLMRDSLEAKKIRAEEKAGQLGQFALVNQRELKKQEEERNATTADIVANGDAKRSSNQNDLENKKYQENDPNAKAKSVLVSEKSFQRNGPDGKPQEYTIQRMIRTGNTTYEYLMIVNKQGNSYFKNGKPISETQWTVETSVEKE